jgi:hypothetical protein
MDAREQSGLLSARAGDPGMFHANWTTWDKTRVGLLQTVPDMLVRTHIP